jgi:hypothetical protein
MYWKILKWVSGAIVILITLLAIQFAPVATQQPGLPTATTTPAAPAPAGGAMRFN